MMKNVLLTLNDRTVELTDAEIDTIYDAMMELRAYADSEIVERANAIQDKIHSLYSED